MSFLQTKASLRRSSPLPAGTDSSRAVHLLLHDHDFFVHCGPHSVEWERVTADEEVHLAGLAQDADAKGEHPLPAAVKEVLEAAAAEEATTTAVTQTYRVTDVVHTLPAGLWDSRVVSTYEMTNLPSGVFVRIRSPLSIVMDTLWTVQPDAESGQLQMVEDVTIYCSRLLVGTVKSLCEGGGQEIHARMMTRLEETGETDKET